MIPTRAFLDTVFIAAANTRFAQGDGALVARVITRVQARGAAPARAPRQTEV